MRNRALLTVLLSGALIACSNDGPGSGERDPVDIDTWTGDLPISAPWLREQLPPGTLTYERIPHPLGLFGIPKGNNLDTALRSEANIQNLMSIQQGLAENFSVELPPLRLFDALRSPIEIAAIGAPPLTSVMIGATLSFRSNAEFESYLAELGQLAAPGLGLAAPLDNEGFGQLLLPPGLPIQIFVNFDASTGRLALFGGLIADRGTFANLLEPSTDSPDHPMRALETQIDDSGQGMFVWLDAAQAMQAAGMVAPEVAQALRASPANQVRSLALGAGVAEGKGRLKLLLDVGTNSSDRPLPIVNNEITATSVGETRHLFLLSIPGAEEFSRLESLVLSNFPPEVSNGWADAKAALLEATGTTIEEVLAAVGPEVITISDQAGDYIGLHVQDHALFDSVIERWTAQAGISIDERVVGGETIRYLELPGTLGLPQEAFAGEAAPMLEIISRMRTRLYWVADGDYVYLASTPQMLIDRVSLGADSSIADWLAENQRMDMSSSLIAATGSMERLPRLMYNAYVGVSQTLADLVGAEYDIWAMPTVNQLGLPERGSLGFSLNMGQPYVSLELSYESHPAEMIFGGGGMAAVAAVGIVAAIALPAYQDYTIRAQVSEGLALAGMGRAAISEAYLSSGEAPANRVAAGLSANAADTQGRYVASVDIANGEIIVRYGNAANNQIANETLVITPYAGPDGSVVFRCGHAAPPGNLEPIGAATLDGTTLQPQYLPSGCRP